ncbi:MAG: hypothetical protein IT310_13135 [Anaerolineales bacterium]|nr:hypothetical protein [Anaerolineales bacterium]
MKKLTAGTSFFVAIFIFGALAGLLLTFFATWADLESAYYGFDYTGGEPFSTLACPIFMTQSETSSFSVKVTNTAERALAPSLITNLSSPVLQIKQTTPLALEAGETKEVKWEIGPQNIDFGHFIFVRAWLHRAYPIKDKENTCGVYVLSLPGRGAYYAWGLAALSLLGMGSGLLKLRQAFGPERGGGRFGRLGALALIVLLGLFFTYQAFWMGGVVVLVLAILLSLISLGHEIRE